MWLGTPGPLTSCVKGKDPTVMAQCWQLASTGQVSYMN